ncbi:MAG: hypothetical protein GWN67_04500 [Phycisphaerae bacterium]|nr:hypothetical protein [Phycisphaerae bacterium]NIP51183.1 hypothetical protein [Phycisphaerae bacterium]NIS50394.1 hypothetical protein [Phycisphaerae bacterium]NIU08124.1 hypothetical protein [Phycisphaerae bacterium]NIU55667.1 hypothetical protein [Phycisphaerae bacterium]
MSVALDGQSLFGSQQLEIEMGSISRDSIERAMPGLDGILSIDLGGRGKEIKQRGVLRAKSRAQMNERISEISAFIDGNTHTLITDGGEEFNDLRMDVFKVSKERAGGGGVAIDYEIVYTQLKVRQ